MIDIEIFWLSNSTFLIKNSTGKKILLDPFTPFGIVNQHISADIITYSKTFNNATNINISNPHCKIINTTDTFKDNYISIKGYSSYSDKINGLKRGKNNIYVLKTDNYKLCHLGYLGHFLNPELIKLLKDMDFLFVPIGGNLSLNGDDAFKLCKELSPKYIIPMCYKCNKNTFYYNDPKSFLSKCKNIKIINDRVIDTTNLSNNSNELVLFIDDKKRIV